MKDTIIRKPGTRRVRPYGTVAYIPLVWKGKEVEWEGDRYDTEEAALQAAKEHMGRYEPKCAD